MKSSLLVVCASSLFIVNMGKGESEESNKFRPKLAKEAMRYASRIAAKQNAKELASTERSVLVERVENGQLIKEWITLAEKEEETTKFEEDFWANKKPQKSGFSKIEDDGNWYRTPQEKQEAFKLARLKKMKVMRKLRAKMLHEGSDEMKVGSSQKKFRPKLAKEAMRYASRIAAKQNAKELASTERSVLVERVEEKEEETTKFEEDFWANKKPQKSGFSKIEDDGNWYRTPQEKQEAFKLARLKKMKVMRKLRAKMLHEGSDEMKVGSSQKKFRPKLAKEAMRYASRIAAKQNAKELASTERSVLVERVENGQLIKERITLAEKEEETTKFEDFWANKKPQKSGFSKIEDDGNWYRTPQEKQEAFKLARLKKMKVMRKLRAKMLHEGSDEMKVGSSQKDDKWRKSMKEMKGKERLLWKRNRLKKRRPRRSADDFDDKESIYTKEFDLESFKKNFLEDKGDPGKEVTHNYEWAKRMGITISTVRIFLGEKHDDVKYIVLKPPPTNWPQPQFNFFQNKYTRFTRPTRYYATIPPQHLRRTAVSRDERNQYRPPQGIYIQKAFKKMSVPTVLKRNQIKLTKPPDSSPNEEGSSEETIEFPSGEQATEIPTTGSIRTSTITWKQSAADQGSRYHIANTPSIYDYNARNYNSYYQRPNYRHINFGYDYNYMTKQPRKIITPVQKKLMLRSEFRNELIRTTAEAEEEFTTTLMTWPTIHRKIGYAFTTRPEMKSWMRRREDWGRRDIWRIDPGHEIPFPPSVINTSRGNSGVWRQDDYMQKPNWNEANYFADDQQRPYRRQYRPPERFANRGGRAQGGQPYRGRLYRGRRRYRGAQYETHIEAIGQSSNSSVHHGIENIVRPVSMPHNVQLGMDVARQWNKLSDPFPQSVDNGQNVVTPLGDLEDIPYTPDVRQPRTPFSNLRLIWSTRTSWLRHYANQTTIPCDSTQQASPAFQIQFSTRIPSQADDGFSMLRPSYMVVTASRPRPPPGDGPSMLRPNYMMTTSRLRSPPDDGLSMLQPSYIVTNRLPTSFDGSSMLQPSYIVTTRMPRSSDGSSMLRPNYVMTTRLPRSSDGSSMLRPSYMEMTALPRPPEFTSMRYPKYTMRSGGHRPSVGFSMLRPSYMTVTVQYRPPEFISIRHPKYEMDAAESAREDNMKARGESIITYRRRFARTKRQRMGRRKYKFLRRQRYKGQREKSIEVFRFGNETVEEEATDDYEKLRMEYLGIGRKTQNIPKAVTAVPKEDAYQRGGYNQQRKQLLEEESLSDVESIEPVEKLYGQRLKTKQEPAVVAEPYMPASLLSESEEESNKENRYRTQVTVPPVELRTTMHRTGATGGKKAKKKHGKKTKNKVTFKYTKPAGDFKWEPYNRYDVPYTFRYTIAPTAVG